MQRTAAMLDRAKRIIDLTNGYIDYAISRSSAVDGLIALKAAVFSIELLRPGNKSENLSDDVLAATIQDYVLHLIEEEEAYGKSYSEQSRSASNSQN